MEYEPFKFYWQLKESLKGNLKQKLYFFLKTYHKNHITVNMTERTFRIDLEIRKFSHLGDERTNYILKIIFILRKKRPSHPI